MKYRSFVCPITASAIFTQQFPILSTSCRIWPKGTVRFAAHFPFPTRFICSFLILIPRSIIFSFFCKMSVAFVSLPATIISKISAYFERNNLSRHRCTDIGSQNNGNRLRKIHKSRTDKPNGHKVINTVRKTKNVIKQLVVPGMFFEGVIESRSSGMKGTYIKVLNEVVFDEIEKLKKGTSLSH